MDRAGFAVALALLAASFYGLIPSCVRLAYESGVPPLESTLFRTSFVIIALGCFALSRRERLVIPRAALAPFLLQASATAMISVGYVASLQFIPVGLAVIIFYTCPIMILIAAPLVEGTRPRLVRFATALWGFAGLLVALGFSLEGLDLRGVALAAIGAIGYALQFFSGRALTRHLSPSVMASLVHAAVLPVVLGIALWQNGGTIRLIGGVGISVEGYASMAGVTLCYVLGYLFQMLALRYAQASVIAPMFNVEPIVTTAVAALLLGERLSLHQYVGGLMVLGALAAASLIARREEWRDLKEAPALAERLEAVDSSLG